FERAAVVGIEVAALNPCQQTVGDLRAEVGTAASHRAQGVEQFGGRCLLEDECARAAADGGHHGVFIVVHRKDDDLHCRAVAEQFGGRLNAVHAGQPDVHQGDVRLGSLAQVHRVGAAFGFPHHTEFRYSLENPPDAIAHQLVVVDENNI